jgi:hypothetical protein
MKTEPLAPRARRLALPILGILLLAVLLAFVTQAIRTGSFESFRSGTVTVTDLPEGAVVYVDNDRSKRSGGGDITLSLSSGNHLLVVDAEGFEPWSQLVSIEKGSAVTVRPILIGETRSARQLSTEDQGAARSLAFANQETGAALRATLGCVEVRASGRDIIASATSTDSCVSPSYLCEDGTCEPTLITNVKNPIRAVVPFPGRDDAVIVAHGDSVIVLELDPREPQFAALLYQGTAPLIAPWSDTEVALVDGERVVALRTSR